MYDVITPDPAGTIQSLASLGYTPEAALADLIDNSIAAGATRVAIDFHWGGAEGSSVAVRDDGRGMTEEELRIAMTVGARGHDEDRSPADLGRFGMGLKTASFSQCRQLVVAARPDGGAWSSRTWDVDLVLETGEWRLLHEPDDGAAAELARLTKLVGGSGTVVLWTRLTRLAAPGSVAGDEWAQREFLAKVDAIERHLAMVFSRYISRRQRPLSIFMNGQRVEPWDPFMRGHQYVETLPAELPSEGVRIQGHVMPHRSRLSEAEHAAAGGPGGWLDQQGFYVYRQDRLIVSGDWLELGFRKDDRHALARIAVEVSTAHDGEWAVDVRKSTATPPAALVRHLRRLARATRERAAAVISHRGRVVRDRQTSSEDLTWRLVRQHGRSRFEINRDHTLVKDLLDRAPELRPAMRALLGMIEETLPMELIRVTPAAETEEVRDSEEPVPGYILEMATRVLDSLVSKGSSPRDALPRLLRMPPFDEYLALATQLAGDERPAGEARVSHE